MCRVILLNRVQKVRLGTLGKCDETICTPTLNYLSYLKGMLLTKYPQILTFQSTVVLKL